MNFTCQGKRFLVFFEREGNVMHNIVIKTERLLLRPLTVRDADAVYEWVSDERVTRYMNYLAYTSVKQVGEWLVSVTKDSSTYHFGFERIADGKLIGSGDISPDGNTVYVEQKVDMLKKCGFQEVKCVYSY